MVEKNTDRDLAHPFFLIDDDNWLYIFSTVGALVAQMEPGYPEETKAVYDGNARPLVLTASDDGTVSLDLQANVSDVAGMSAHVSAFFEEWTSSEPPTVSTTSPEAYAQAVAAAYKIAQLHRRRPRAR